MASRPTLNGLRVPLGTTPRAPVTETAPLVSPVTRTAGPPSLGRMPFEQTRGSDMDFRMRYYNSLVGKMNAPNSINTEPEHMVPAELYHVHTDEGSPVTPGDGKQSSWTTIFSVWNTMMGSSLMAMPWGFQHAGLIGGVLMSLLVGLICWYTCWIVLKLSSSRHRDLFELCQEYLGSAGRWISWIFAIAFAVGILVSYDIIMTTSLLDFVDGIREYSNNGKAVASISLWNKYWASAVVACFAFAISALSRYFRLLVKINTWALILLIYIIVFFLGMAMSEGVKPLPKEALFRLNFGWLSGVLVASFVLHNAIINIMKNQRQPEHNLRDLTIGYGLSVGTYLLVGSVCFVCFRTSAFAYQHDIKAVLPQDFLHIFPKQNVGAMIARIALFLYTLSAYPLLATIVRIQFFGMLWDSQFPGWIHVLALNFVLVSIGTIFAVLLPMLADVLRFVGAFAGAVLSLFLPTAIYWVYQKNCNDSTRTTFVLRTLAASVPFLCGVALIVGQFV